jgi:hypothetical protein
MIAAHVSMMLDLGLTAAEKTKFDRVQDRLAAMFAEKGYAVRLCQGTLHGNCRMIGFVAGLVGPAIVTIPASQFLSATDNEMPYILDPTQGLLNTPVAVYAVDRTIFVETLAPNVIRQYRKGEFLGVFTHRHSYIASISATGKGEDGMPKNIQECAATQPNEWQHEKRFPTRDA